MTTKAVTDLFACIHLGSERISLEIVEYNSLSDIRILEDAGRNVSLGEETFRTGKISYDTMYEVCELLIGYRRMLQEYSVRKYKLVATTAIWEASNRQYVIDQIYIKTGFAIEVLDMPQEIFYKYASLFKAVQEDGYLQDQEATLFVDVSSGGLGLTLYQDGRIDYQQNIHMGAIRIKGSFEQSQRDSANFHLALSEYIYSLISPVKRELASRKIGSMILSGMETKLFRNILGYQQDSRLMPLDLNDFAVLYEQVKDLKLTQIMKNFSLEEDTAATVLPIIVLCKQILSLIEVEQVLLSANRLMDGIIVMQVASETGNTWTDLITEQVLSFVRALGEKFHYDSCHALQVEKISLQLFDRLVKVHGLGQRERLLLQVACILHDTGKHVSLRRHYAYSYDLLLSSDILGFSDEEKKVMANVVYYHSKYTPGKGDANFKELSDSQRIVAAKLIAIIRLADAMDRSHRQKVKECLIMLKGNKFFIRAITDEDMSLEEWTFQDKAMFFEEVFGILPILQIQVR